jgi:hypothetical protein
VKWALQTFFVLNNSISLQASVTLAVYLVFFTSIPEPASFSYWLATLETYTLPFFIFLFLLKQYGTLLISKKQGISSILICCLLTIVLAGSNEFMGIMVLAVPSCALLLFTLNKRKIPVYIFVLIGVALIAFVCSVALPGNGERTGHYTNKQNLLFSITGGVYRLNKVTMTFLSNPLFYLGCLAAFLLSAKLRAEYVHHFNLKKTSWWMELGGLYIIALAFHILVRQIGGAVVPDRVSNIINCVLILGVWGVIIVNGSWVRNKVDVKIYSGSKSNLLQLAFCVLLIFSGFTNELMQNLFVAPVHYFVISDRISRINSARAQGRKSVVIPAYDSTAKQFMKEKFSEKKARFYTDEFTLPPTFTYFKDEPASDESAYFFAEYYGIDTLYYGNKYILRWGLSEHHLKKE